MGSILRTSQKRALELKIFRIMFCVFSVVFAVVVVNRRAARRSVCVPGIPIPRFYRRRAEPLPHDLFLFSRVSRSKFNHHHPPSTTTTHLRAPSLQPPQPPPHLRHTPPASFAVHIRHHGSISAHFPQGCRTLVAITPCPVRKLYGADHHHSFTCCTPSECILGDYTPPPRSRHRRKDDYARPRRAHGLMRSHSVRARGGQKRTTQNPLLKLGRECCPSKTGHIWHRQYPNTRYCVQILSPWE